MVTVFILLGTVSLLVALHPFLTYPLSLLPARKRRPRGQPPATAEDSAPSVAICCAAYNEESVIGEKAHNMLAAAADYGAAEVWFYVDGASDQTAQVLASFGDRVNVVSEEERCGKSHGMNELVRHTQADIVMFTDANVMFETDAVSRLVRYFTDPAVGCVCGHLSYHGTDASGTAMAGGFYWRLEEWIKQLESDSGSVMGADGSVFAVRRTLHNPVPADIIDDMYVSLDILCQGYRVVRAPDVLAYEAAIPAARDEFRRKVRITCQAFNVHRLMWPNLRRLGAGDMYKYISHKLIRWFGGFFLLAGWLLLTLGCFAADLGAQALLVMALLLAVFAAGSVLGIRLARVAGGILSAFAATAVGILESMRGRRYQVWSPADSIRLAKGGVQ